ncbi:MAG: hypothetical protein WC465_02130 [Patescibacteria group bacterium]
MEMNEGGAYRYFWPLMVTLTGAIIVLFSVGESNLVCFIGALVAISGLIFFLARSRLSATRTVIPINWFALATMLALYLWTHGGLEVSTGDWLVSLLLALVGTAVLCFLLLLTGFWIAISRRL